MAHYDDELYIDMYTGKWYAVIVDEDNNQEVYISPQYATAAQAEAAMLEWRHTH